MRALHNMITKIAILGSGIFATHFYLPVLLKSSEVELTAIWSRSQSSAEKFASIAVKSGIDPDNLKIYFGENGLSQLLRDDNVHAIIMALAITAQPPLVLRCLEAGKHVLSEKPVGKDIPTAKSLIKSAQELCKTKGIIWRVAENMAHDTTVLEMGQVLRDPALGPVLYWHMHQELSVTTGSMWHATEWRTIPDFQGGFILDGGVHMAAILRVALPTPPTRIISTAHLHRSHLPPHDIVMGLALPSTSDYMPPHGDQFATGELARIPGSVGMSAPHGSIILSWANAQLSAEHEAPSFTFEVHCLNGNVTMTMKGSTFEMARVGAVGSDVKNKVWQREVDGLATEVDMFARAVRWTGGQEANHGRPEDALWDLGFIEALLTSNGKEVDLVGLIKDVSRPSSGVC